MNILALTLVGHFTVAAFKPLNLFKVWTKEQTIVEEIKPNQIDITEAFGRAA